jgi:hypothetical protein
MSHAADVVRSCASGALSMVAIPGFSLPELWMRKGAISQCCLPVVDLASCGALRGRGDSGFARGM